MNLTKFDYLLFTKSFFIPHTNLIALHAFSFTSFQFSLIRNALPIPSTQPQENDQYLMKYFITQHLPDKTLATLNSCRIYLRVIHLSDILSADGSYILPKIKQGKPLQTWQGKLQWPTQGKPTCKAWEIWRCHLQHLETRDRLLQPLGAWVASPHQTWTQFQDPNSRCVYLVDAITTKLIRPIVIPNPRTRASYQPW